MQQPFTSLNPNPNFTKIINKKKLNKEFTCYNKKSKPIFHKNQNRKLNNLNVKYPNPNPNFTIIKTKNQINNLPSKNQNGYGYGYGYGEEKGMGMDVAEGCGEIEEERSRRVVVLGVGTGLGWDRRHWVPEAVCVWEKERPCEIQRKWDRVPCSGKSNICVVGNERFKWEIKNFKWEMKYLCSGKWNTTWLVTTSSSLFVCP